MKSSLRYFAPTLVIMGSILMAVLTFLNMMYFYYGWTEFVLSDRTKEVWTSEEVKSAFRSFVANGWSGILIQAIPVGIVFLGGIFCLIQSHSNKVTKRSDEHTTDPPPDQIEC